MFWPVCLQKEFEGTGGVLLDVSHAKPHPYHGKPGRYCFSGIHMLLLPQLLPWCAPHCILLPNACLPTVYCLQLSIPCSVLCLCLCLCCAGEGVGRREEVWRPRKRSEGAAPEEGAHENE